MKMQKCPVKGCDHVGLVMTRNHARTHGYHSLYDLIKAHGMPEEIREDNESLKRNMATFIPVSSVNRQYGMGAEIREFRKEQNRVKSS